VQETVENARVTRRAILYGKYGCAIFVQNCGTEALRALSLGKIQAFVGFAIKSKFLRHCRTSIVLCEENQQSPSQCQLGLKNELERLKRMVFLMFLENGNAPVFLSQLPLQFQRKYG
jgi:hypothetical protein